MLAHQTETAPSNADSVQKLRGHNSPLPPSNLHTLLKLRVVKHHVDRASVEDTSSQNGAHFPTHSVGAERRRYLGPCLSPNTSAHSTAHVLNDRFDEERREHSWPLPLSKMLTHHTERAASTTNSAQKLCGHSNPCLHRTYPLLKPLLTKHHLHHASDEDTSSQNGARILTHPFGTEQRRHVARCVC